MDASAPPRGVLTVGRERLPPRPRGTSFPRVLFVCGGQQRAARAQVRTAEVWINTALVWGPPYDRVPLSGSPEPEPGVRRRVCPRGSGHDQRSGRVQNQDVHGPVPASAHAGERHGPVKQPAPTFYRLRSQAANSPFQWLWVDSSGVYVLNRKGQSCQQGSQVCGSCCQRLGPFWVPAVTWRCCRPSQPEAFPCSFMSVWLLVIENCG